MFSRKYRKLIWIQRFTSCMNFQTGESMQPWTALVDLSIILHDYKLGGAVCPICHVTVGLQALNISSVFA